MTSPKPAQRRRRSITAKQREKFLEALAAGWAARHAADHAGRHRRRFYDLRATDEEFAAAWEEAEATGTEALEDEARRRAVDGWEEPVYQQGELVGHVRKYSDGLLTFLLRGRLPEKYREGANLAISATVNQLHIAPDPEQVDRVLATLRDVGVLTHVPRPRELTEGEVEGE